MKQYEMRLTGSGGQGLILAGIILAEAALMDNKNGVQSQSYGPEARGGASKAEVIISENAINFPKVTVPNLILSLTQVAADKYIETIAEDGVVIADSKIVLPEGLKAGKILSVPIIKAATEEVGKSIVSNIVALGLIQEMSQMVTKESLEKAVLARVPKGTEALNKAALAKGYELAENYK